jgi:hypothetical protein
MAFTRFHDDPGRIAKQLQQMTDQGRWAIDVPGPGDKPYYISDPYIRPQKWAGNLMANSIDINSSLLGIDRNLNRDCLINNNNNNNNNIYKKSLNNTYQYQYENCDEFLTTEQSRSVMPAWMYRDLPQNNSQILFENPQIHTEMVFNNNISTRILEKDNYNINKKLHSGFREENYIINMNIPENSQDYTILRQNEKKDK